MKIVSSRTVRRSLIASALTLIGVGSATNAAMATPEADPYAIVLKVLETHIIPHVTAFKTAAAKLPETIAHVCERGDKSSRTAAAKSFREAIESYAAIEFLRFGPLQQSGLREKLSFWPDPRGILPRQMRQLLTSPDAATADVAFIKKQSAALQGLPALEILLTDRNTPLAPGPESVTQCALAKSIAGAIADNAAAFDTAWTKDGGWKDKMLRPGSDNDTYKEPSEAASELVKALLVGFQLVADVQLKPRLDAKDKATGPYAASNLTQAHYTAFVTSLNQFYDTLGLELYLGDDQLWVKNWASGAWRAIRASDGLGGRVADASRSTSPTLREVFDKTTGLRKLVSRELATASHLTVGFNELDGD
ncbi:MAG: imelysin family protein [Hyphomicrobium sp.]|nr:imelysin family protein [Hyphomicrobium sp.]